MSTIYRAENPAHFAHASRLLQLLLHWDIAISRQAGFDPADYMHAYYADELRDMASAFPPPHACLLLAEHQGQVVGMAGFKRFAEQVCELKCIFVDDAARGQGLGGQLVRGLLEAARQAGYQRMLLETTTQMPDAIQLYQRHGFTPCENFQPDFDGSWDGLSVHLSIVL